jgi:CBS domain-containing protein
VRRYGQTIPRSTGPQPLEQHRRFAMQIITILRRKGTDVATIVPGASIREALAVLHQHRCGALVVSTDGRRIEGIVSERDIVRALHTIGASLLDGSVRDLMSHDVHTCGPTDTVDEVMRTMSTQRFRHLPVVENGVLAGIVSIGDVVKLRIDALEHEAEQLRSYVLQP